MPKAPLLVVLALAAPCARSLVWVAPARRTLPPLFAKGKGRKLAGASQADLQKRFEDAKLQAQQQKNLDVAHELGAPAAAAADQPDLEMNPSWRKPSAQQAYAELGALVDNTPRTLQGKFDSFEMQQDLSAAPLYAATPLGASVQYLKVGQPAPLEVWTALRDPSGEYVPSFASVQTSKPLVLVCAHHREASAKLKAALECIDQQLPRKSFKADLVVVTRDPPPANGRLAKAMAFPATVLSAEGAVGNGWSLSYGITSQLSEFGVSLFAVDTERHDLFAVAYDVDPLAVAELLKKVVAAHAKRFPGRYA